LSSALFPYTPLFRSDFAHERGNRHGQTRVTIGPGLLRRDGHGFVARARIMRADLGTDAVLERRDDLAAGRVVLGIGAEDEQDVEDRKSTRLNSSHVK